MKEDIDQDLFFEMLQIALRVSFLTTNEERFHYATALYHAKIWGNNH